MLVRFESLQVWLNVTVWFHSYLSLFIDMSHWFKHFDYFCELFHTCKVNRKCFLYSPALQHTTYLQSKLPQAARRRAQSTASFVARRLVWRPAMSAGTDASSMFTCAPPHTLTSRLCVSLSLLVLEAPILLESGLFLLNCFSCQPSFQWISCVHYFFHQKLLTLSRSLLPTSMWITSLSRATIWCNSMKPISWHKPLEMCWLQHGQGGPHFCEMVNFCKCE